jgi:very-short-patch-repair endonuclease
MRPRQIVNGQRVSEAKVVVSRAMRHEMTQAETALWARLRNRQVGGTKFRRQQIIAGFVADFYCHDEALVIEVDGPTHQAQHDKERDAVFAGRGITVLRFSNDEVLNTMENVIEQILHTITTHRTRS